MVATLVQKEQELIMNYPKREETLITAADAAAQERIRELERETKRLREENERLQRMTERQWYIITLRNAGKNFDEIGLAYQERFHTKQKLNRESIRMTLATFGLWPPPHV